MKVSDYPFKYMLYGITTPFIDGLLGHVGSSLSCPSKMNKNDLQWMSNISASHPGKTGERDIIIQ